MHTKENHINIGKTIEITLTLENYEYLKVRDTDPISSIGSIMSDVQEIKAHLTEIREYHHDIIIDAEPVDVVQNHKEEQPVIAVDVEPKTPESQADFSLKQDEIREIIDEIYNADITQCHKFKLD